MKKKRRIRDMRQRRIESTLHYLMATSENHKRRACV